MEINYRGKREMVKTKEKIDNKVVITGIVCITLLEALALYLGINGILLTGVIAIIAAAIGLVTPTPTILKQ